MKRFSACGLLLILVLTGCERSVKPSEAEATKPPAAIAKRESIDQTPELETHPRALEYKAAAQPIELPLPRRVPAELQSMVKKYFNAVPDGFTATVNHWCPVMQKMKLNASTAVEHTVEFDDMTIGFCCEDCVDAWKAMDDTERRERLKAVMAKP